MTTSGMAIVRTPVHTPVALRVAAVMVALGAALGVGPVAATDAEIGRLAWLAGCWRSEQGEPGSGERWTPLAGGTLLGVSRTVRQGRTVAFEFMELRHLPDGALAYIAHPSGQRRTTFTLLRLSDVEAVFENPTHDFPQRVAYAREGAQKLRARIEGQRQGQLRVIEFPMERVSCEVEPAR